MCGGTNQSGGCPGGRGGWVDWGAAGRNFLGGVLLLCLDRNMGYIGVCICQSLLTGTPKSCAAHCLQLHLEKEQKQKQTINNYWTPVNNICAEVFRGQVPDATGHSEMHQKNRRLRGWVTGGRLGQ